MTPLSPGSDRPACVTLGLRPSFGFGDRIGLATPGHVEAMRRAGAGIEPIFPQQSIREMARTGRTPAQVMDDALDGMAPRRLDRPDGRRRRPPEDPRGRRRDGRRRLHLLHHRPFRPGRRATPTTTTRRRSAIGSPPWPARSTGSTRTAAGRSSSPTGTAVSLDERACLRAAVKYGRAINQALRLADHITRVNEAAGRDYEIELSVDETDQPTTLAEHYIIADQCLQRGMKLVSLAPRYIGDFEKGVDYKGDLAALERSLGDHAAIAELLGPYKLSLHSGSDKLSMYPALARATRGRFHVKTAGTSYLEALRVVARHEPGPVPPHDRLRPRPLRPGQGHLPRLGDARLGTPPPRRSSDAGRSGAALPGALVRRPPGAGLHRSPGGRSSTARSARRLTDPELGPAVRQVLEQHTDTYTEVLADHFSRHLEALRAGM